MKKILAAAFIIGLTLSCTEKEDEETFTYVNGTYKAVEAEYSYGWKGFLEITVDKDVLTALEFDYNDADGAKKSETTQAEYPMDPHPSVWTPTYNTALNDADILDFSDIDAVSGATHSADLANELMKVLLEAAKTGDMSEQIVSLD